MPTESSPICGTSPQTAQPPIDAMSVDELSTLATSLYQDLLAEEKSVTLRYWRLGRALNQLRSYFKQGTWEEKLRELVIDKTMASRARRIAARHASEADVAGLTVREALGVRPRRAQRKRPRQKTAPAVEFDLLEFLEYVNANTSTLLHAARRVESIQATGLLMLVAFALGNLAELKLILTQRAAGGRARPVPPPTMPRVMRQSLAWPVAALPPIAVATLADQGRPGSVSVDQGPINHCAPTDAQPVATSCP